MISGLFWMVVANAAIFLTTHLLWRRVRCSDAALDPVLFLLIRLLLISATVLIAGTTGGLVALPLGIAGAVLLATMLALGEHKRLSAPGRPDVGRATAVLAALVAVRMLFQVWFYAPFSLDGIAYHLPKVGEWIRSGAFTREMGLDPCVTFPAGFELIETWWVVFLHHDLLIELAGVEYAVLAFAAVRAIALKLGQTPRTAVLAATLFVLTPIFNLQVTSCLNDAPIAGLFLATAALTFGRAHPLLLFIPVALMAGTKGTGLYALPGLALLCWLRRAEPILRPGSTSWTIPLSVGSAIVGSFWYARNALWFGNPTHPMTPQGMDVGGVHVQAGPNLSSLSLNLSDLLANLVSDSAAGYRVDAYRISGWGVLAFSVGVISLIQGLREERLMRHLAATFAVSLLSVFTLVSHDIWYMRFVIFAPAILSLATARMAATFRPIAMLVALGAALQFASTLLPGELGYGGTAASLISQPWRERSVAPLLDCAPLPRDEPVAMYSTRRTPTYMLYGADFSHRVAYFRVRNAEHLLQEMSRAGVRYVYVDVTSVHRKADLEAIVQAGRLKPLNPHLYVVP